MPESVQEVKGIRLLATATGILSGSGVGYLAAYFADVYTEPPLFYWSLLFFLLPFFVLAIIVLALAIRKPLSTGDSLKFTIYFWAHFLFFYLVTWFFYWLPKV